MIDATDHYFFSCDKKFVLDFHEEVDTGSDAALIAVAVFHKHLQPGQSSFDAGY
eukprot:m.253867 g.253867  ORF g.253867 m.253867 type:complete len:54 (+) comp40375_c1_seq10:1297-1458(+)